MNCERNDSLDAGAGLVVWPQTVAERLDHVIRGDSDMSCSILEHLRNRTEHARHRALRRIGFLEAPNPVEVTKEFVGAVDQVNDHLSTDDADCLGSCFSQAFLRKDANGAKARREIGQPFEPLHHLCENCIVCGLARRVNL